MMKNKWLLYVGVFLVMTAFPALAMRCFREELGEVKTESINGVQYAYCITNGVAIIGSGNEFATAVSTNTTGVVKIPATIGGHPVGIIASDAFANCTGLTEVVLPYSVTMIETMAFSACSNLTAVSLNEGLRSIGTMAFRECVQFKTVALPKSLESIGCEAFRRCNSLTSIPVEPENPKYVSIDGVVFKKDGTFLTVYPAGRQGHYTVPDKVKRCNLYTLESSTGLTSLALPASIDYAGCFQSPNLISLTVDPANTNFTSIDGVVFNKTCTRIKLYPRGRQGAYTIPKSVNSLDYYAFSSCKNLTSITIPDGVKEIPHGAFSHCKNLTEVVIPNSVTNINDDAFYKCTSITSVVIPPCVTNLQEIFPHSYKKITNVVRLAAAKE